MKASVYDWSKVSLSFYSSIAFLCVLKHFNNGNAVPCVPTAFQQWERRSHAFPLEITPSWRSRVNWNCYHYYQKNVEGARGRRCSSKGGACATAQWPVLACVPNDVPCMDMGLETWSWSRDRSRPLFWGLGLDPAGLGLGGWSWARPKVMCNRNVTCVESRN